MDQCSWCMKYHPDWQICDEYLTHLEKLEEDFACEFCDGCGMMMGEDCPYCHGTGVS